MARFDTLRRFGRRSEGDTAVARSLDRWLDGDPVADAASTSNRAELAALQRSATVLFELTTVADGATIRSDAGLRRDGWSRLMASAPTTNMTPLPATFGGRGRTRAGAWATAAAIVAVIVLLGAALRGVVEPGNGGKRDQAPSILTAASPTAPSGAVDNEIAGRGGADRAWNFSGSLSPTLGQPVPIEVAGYEFRTITNAQVFGDLLVAQDLGIQASDPELVAVDLRTRTVAWTRDIFSTGGFASDGERLVLWQQGPPEYGLLALDLATGEMLWRFDDPSSTVAEYSGDGPILYQGMVYMHDGGLAIYAVDADDGSQVWSVERESDTLVPWSQRTQSSPTQVSTPVEFAVEGSLLYSLRESHIVEVFDRATGDPVWTTTLNVQGTTLSSDGSSLAVADGQLFVGVSYAASDDERQYPGANLEVTVFDADDGQQVWSRTWTDVDGNMVIAGGRVLLPSQGELVAIDGVTGEDLAALTLGDGVGYRQLQSIGGMLVLSEWVGELSRVSVVDRDLQSLTWTWSRMSDHIHMTPVLSQVLLWNDGVVLVTYEEGVLIASETGGATPVATPQGG